MRQFSTPKHTFELPFPADKVVKLHVTYSQCNKVIFKKTEQDCVYKDNLIILKLRQEDTALLKHEHNVQIQIHVLTDEGQSLVSPVWERDVEVCLGGEVL